MWGQILPGSKEQFEKYMPGIVAGRTITAVGITEQNISLLKSGKVRGVRFETLERICAALRCPRRARHGPATG